MPGCMAWNRPRHITDQRQLVSEDMGLVAFMHHTDGFLDTIFLLSVKYASQRGAKFSVNLLIQIIDPSGKLS